MLEPYIRRDGERYATATEIESCEDLPSMDCTPKLVYTRSDGTTYEEPLWTREDGTPLVIRVQAPSIRQRRIIVQAAKDDNDQFILETCLELRREAKI